MRNTADHLRILKKYAVALCLITSSSIMAFSQDLVLANSDPGQAQQSRKTNKIKTVPLRVFMQQFQEVNHIYFSYSSKKVKVDALALT